MILIDPKIGEHVDAAIKAGFTVYATESNPGTTGWVALCLDEAGPWAHIQKPAMALDPVQLDVPIIPSKEYGSCVLVDHDGTPEDAVRALRQACSEDTVKVRFVNGFIPIVPNAGRKCIAYCKDRVVKLGQRGTNWMVQQQAGRLEVGDRFEVRLEGRDHTTLTVTGRKYGGRDYGDVILTVAELAEPLQLSQREPVILVGAA